MNASREGSTVEQAVLLVGGRGTRLGSQTADTPKPLLPVGGRPFLDWLLDFLAAEGIRRVVLTTGYLAETFDPWLSGGRKPVEIEIHVEETPLGTGGALPLIRDRLDGVVAVMNGDTIFDASPRELNELRRAEGVRAAVGLRRVGDTGRYGSVGLDGPRVVSFAEKGQSGPGLINGGIYVVEKSVLEDTGSPSSIERDLMPSLVEQGDLVARAFEGFFLDIGVPAELERAQTAVPEWWGARS